MDKKCACRGDFLDKLVQPAILSLLCEKEAHGFYLLTELERRELISSADAAGFYRTLHRLENDGKINSVWETVKGEKPRRVYSINENGLECLHNWQRTLKQYSARVEKIIAAADRAAGLVRSSKGTE